MIVTIHQPQYLPWLGYFDKADRAEVFILLDDVQFKKNEWQNRNKIRTSQGWQWLTVPVLHDFGQKINEVRINNKIDWKKSHFKALQMNYSKAPFYHQYIAEFELIYKKDWEFLVDINVYFIERMLEFLGMKTKIVLSSQFKVMEDATQRLVELCRKYKATTYISGKDGQKYMDDKLFKESNIQIVTQDYRHPVYSQQWNNESEKGFLSHMSIVDVLFNHGPDSLKIIRNKKVIK